MPLVVLGRRGLIGGEESRKPFRGLLGLAGRFGELGTEQREWNLTAVWKDTSLALCGVDLSS